VFSQTTVKESLNRYTLVELYADKVPPEYQGISDAEANRQLQIKFGSTQLPFYVILKPLGNGAYEKLSAYAEGKINDVPGFVQFLQRPLEARQVSQAPSARPDQN
jgi:hypothetical protein